MSASTATSATVPPGLAIAKALPDLMRPVKIRRGVLGFLRNNPTVAIGGTLLLVLVLIGVFAAHLGTVDPTALAPSKRLRAPSADFWFGTDALGRDIYSRVLFGTRVSLTVGLSVALLATLVGLTIGLVSGFLRWADSIIMRVMDGLMLKLTGPFLHQTKRMLARAPQVEQEEEEDRAQCGTDCPKDDPLDQATRARRSEDYNGEVRARIDRLCEHQMRPVNFGAH